MQKPPYYLSPLSEQKQLVLTAYVAYLQALSLFSHALFQRKLFLMCGMGFGWEFQFPGG